MTHPFLSLSAKASGLSLGVSDRGTPGWLPDREAAPPPGTDLHGRGPWAPTAFPSKLQCDQACFLRPNDRVGPEHPRPAKAAWFSEFRPFFLSVGNGKRNAFGAELWVELPGLSDLCTGHCFLRRSLSFHENPGKACQGRKATSLPNVRCPRHLLPARGRMWTVSGVKTSDQLCFPLALRSAANCGHRAHSGQSRGGAASSLTTSSCWAAHSVR